jgi:hypothetical protein
VNPKPDGIFGKGQVDGTKGIHGMIPKSIFTAQP